MALFHQVSIIGVGLMGGSAAKAIRKKRLARKIVGFFRNKQKQKRALSSGIVDEGFFSLKESVKNSDLIILAVPIHHIIRFMAKLKNIADKNAVIIDMGSEKSSVTKAAQQFRLNFVGTHPLTGSEKKGADYSLETLFNNSCVILTPTKKTSLQALRKVRKFWTGLNAKVAVLSPDLHDTILAHTSHLPHVVAFSLMNAIPEKYLSFAATGLKDTTRIALSDASLWADILSYNRKHVLRSIARFQRALGEMKHTLERKHPQRLMSMLHTAQRKRQTIN